MHATLINNLTPDSDRIDNVTCLEVTPTKYGEKLGLGVLVYTDFDETIKGRNDVGEYIIVWNLLFGEVVVRMSVKDSNTMRYFFSEPVDMVRVGSSMRIVKQED